MTKTRLIVWQDWMTILTLNLYRAQDLWLSNRFYWLRWYHYYTAPCLSRGKKNDLTFFNTSTTNGFKRYVITENTRVALQVGNFLRSVTLIFLLFSNWEQNPQPKHLLHLNKFIEASNEVNIHSSLLFPPLFEQLEHKELSIMTGKRCMCIKLHHLQHTRSL